MNNEIEINIESNTQQVIDVDVKEIVDYVDLKNKPKINGVELVGDKTTEDLGIDIDTSKYATKEELSGKADKADTYTKAEVDGLIPDVQVNGTSIVKEGVANIPIAAANQLGLVRPVQANGIYVSNTGTLNLSKPSNATLISKNGSYAVLINQLDLATKVGITTNTIELTADEQTAAKTWLGVPEVPTKTSELENDSGFITADDIGGGASSLEDIAVAGDNIKFTADTKKNYSVVGTPTIEDSVVSGFSSSSCLTTENPFVAEECTRVEMVLVFEMPELVAGPMFATANPDTVPYFRVNTATTGLLTISYTDVNGEQKNASANTSFITANTKIWYKALWVATSGLWIHYISSDEGATWKQIKNNSGYANPPSLLSGDTLYWGRYGASSTTYFNGKIYLEDSYIKTTSASGSRTLSFVEATGKTEISAEIPDVDLTGYLQNTATGTNSLTLGGVASTANNAVNVGLLSEATQTGSTAYGMGAKSKATGGTAIGVGSQVVSGAYQASALGYKAIASAKGAIQLGFGTNSAENTVYVGFYDGTNPVNYKLIDGDGQIPGERMSLQGTTAPTTETVGSIGQFYVDTASGTGYMKMALPHMRNSMYVRKTNS